MGLRRRVVSGMRPTGPLHVGHYVGALRAWVGLQREHECFFFAADWHVLTDRQEEPGRVEGWIREMVADWIACGVDPERSVIFVQSARGRWRGIRFSSITIFSIPTERRWRISRRDIRRAGWGT
ncbi:MAG: hypothetical protein ACK44W_06530 [Planctomycetota bacterium]